MWLQDAQDFVRIPKLMLPKFAPLSQPMVEHLLILEYRPYRRRRSVWPPQAEILSNLHTRFLRARREVYKYMDVFVRADLVQAKEQGASYTFPDDEWLLEILKSYTPDNRENSHRTFEDWRAAGILIRDPLRDNRWKLSSVASLLIMRLMVRNLQQGWLPKEISVDEPRWWMYAKSSPNSPTISVPAPLAGRDGSPVLMWTDWLGSAWSGKRQQFGMQVAQWSKPFASAEEVAIWNPVYADEIQQVAERVVTVSAAEMHLIQDGILITSNRVQQAVRETVQRVYNDVITAMLQEAAQRILQEELKEK